MAASVGAIHGAILDVVLENSTTMIATAVKFSKFQQNSLDRFGAVANSKSKVAKKVAKICIFRSDFRIFVFVLF